MDSFSPPSPPPPISSQALFGTLLFASRVLSSPPFLSVSRETLLPRGPSSRDLRPITDHRLQILAPSPLPRNRTPWNPSLFRILLDIQIFKLRRSIKRKIRNFSKKLSSFPNFLRIILRGKSTLTRVSRSNFKFEFERV